MNHSTPCRTLLLVCALVALAPVPARAAALTDPALAGDPVLTYSGYLRDASGRPVAVPTTIAFRLYAAEEGGAAMWEEPVTVVPDAEGWFAAVLGAATPMSAGLFSAPLWLALHVEGDAAEMSPRARLTAAPYALAVDWARIANKPSSFPAAWEDVTGKPASFATTWANVADKPATFPVDPAVVQRRLAGACPAGHYLRAVAEDGSVTCGADAIGAGTVTAVGAVAPLAVANGTTTPTISVSQASATTPGYLSSSDWSTFNAKLGSSSAVGGDLQGTAASPTVKGLQGRPVSNNLVYAGQLLRFDGTTWVPTTPTLVCQTRDSGAVSVAPGSGSATVQCLAGEYPGGGSGRATPESTSVVVASMPNGNGWTATVANGSGGAVSLIAYVQCCRIHFQ